MAKPSVERECRVFTDYLLRCAPQPYVLQKYADAHHVSPVFSQGSRFDLHLLRVATVHRSLTRLADAYARALAPRSLLRKKLVLLLAILETCAPTCQMIDAVDGGGKPALLVRLFVASVISALSMAVGALWFLPAQVVLTAADRKTE